MNNVAFLVTIRQLFAGLILLFYTNQVVADLPLAVSEQLAQSPVSLTSASIWIAPVDGGHPIVDFQSHLPRAPASTAKAITTGLGLMLLGPDFRWKTEFYYEGTIKEGQLNGDLIIKGYGNPYLVEEDMAMMVATLRQKGLSTINGNVVLDNSYFLSSDESPYAFDGRGLAPYNAIPNALSINFRTIELIMEPTAQGVSVRTDPVLSDTKIDNQMTLSSHKRCRGAGYTPRIDADTRQGRILLSGQLSAACSPKHLTRVLTDAGDLYFSHFHKAWQQAGGVIHGSWFYGKVSRQATLLHRAYSQPLAEQIVAMNKRSNNLMTRQLFLTIGAEHTQPPATKKKSQAVILNQLKKIGVNTDGLFIDNGSGLSRQSRITAAQMGAFLLAIQAQPNLRDFFENSLSVAGVDGTLQYRLRNTPLTGNAIGKTGTLKNVKSLVGYLIAASGRKYAFVFLLEGPKAKSGRQLMDNILMWVYTQ